ncbi:unnamed protein product [Miscanthus lutarioriparius]|uniref:Uncharacterized protein n=1 Tax=Miscanthus lutarioriparius TaxID=422564 RepID=A0A811REX0_9POAL|nr:unnamed protein product [Miscanthus lutarioriparius]
MVRKHLRDQFNIEDDAMSVLRHALEEFIFHFRSRDDLERVLNSRPPPVAASPFVLLWQRWSRLSSAMVGAFTYKVLVGIKGVPAHALSEDVAAHLLGSSCTQVEIATADADGVDDDDARELFVAARCLHPLLVPEQKLLVIPELQEPHDPGILFLREHEIIHSKLPIPHYLARMRVVEYQDWDPSSSSDDGGFPGADDYDDCGDSNYNGYHPGLEDGPSRTRPFGSATFCPGGRDGPSLGRGSGPAFWPRCHAAGVADDVRACIGGSGWVPHPQGLLHEGQSWLGGRAWSWCGMRRFGAGPRVREIADVASPRKQDREKSATIVVGAQMLGTPTGDGSPDARSLVWEVDF